MRREDIPVNNTSRQRSALAFILFVKLSLSPSHLKDMCVCLTLSPEEHVCVSHLKDMCMCLTLSPEGRVCVCLTLSPEEHVCVSHPLT